MRRTAGFRLDQYTENILELALLATIRILECNDKYKA
jgi:hypothetical protein